MGDRFTRLHTLRVDKEACEGDCFKISKETWSQKNLNLETKKNTGLLLKIFVRNKEGHAYFGYVPVSLLADSLDVSAAADELEDIIDCEVPCYPSERCRIASLMVGNQFMPLKNGRHKFMRITIITDENSSFETAVSCLELRGHLYEIGWLGGTKKS